MGRIGLAIEQTTRAYPGLLESNQNLMFMLKCRQFVEMVNGSDLDVSFKFYEKKKEDFFTYTLGIKFSDNITLCTDVRDSIDETLPTVTNGS